MMEPNESKGWLTLGTKTIDSCNVQLFISRKSMNLLKKYNQKCFFLKFLNFSVNLTQNFKKDAE